MLWPKKRSYKKFDNEKKFLRLENSPLPHNFSNGPSLNHFHSEPLEIKENSKASEHGACQKVTLFVFSVAFVQARTRHLQRLKYRSDETICVLLLREHLNLKTNFENDRIRQTLLSSIALYPKQVIQGICMMASGCAFQTLNIDIL